MTKYLAIGLMSGTSMDGVDAALIQTDGKNCCDFIDDVSISYNHSFQKLLKKTESIIRDQDGAFDFKQNIEDHITLQDVIDQSTSFHYDAIQKILHKNTFLNKENYIIGYHGQTFFHQPEKKKSVILGNPLKLAQDLKKNVIFNFRQNDILHDGKGAPLAPIYHHFLAKKSNQMPTVFLNCGGISNATFIEDNDENSIIAFDIGPGNVFLDQFVKLKTQYIHTMDKDGLFGKKGKCDFNAITLLDKYSCLKENFYNQPPPKALDISDFYLPSEIWNLSLEDGCKTLAYFTAKKIIDSLKFVNFFPKTWFIAGGGFYNPNILEGFYYYLKQTNAHSFQINHTDILGYPSKSLEAQLFGYLAIRSYSSLPLSFPKTTGVKAPLTGGVLYSSNGDS